MNYSHNENGKEANLFNMVERSIYSRKTLVYTPKKYLIASILNILKYCRPKNKRHAKLEDRLYADGVLKL